MSQHQCSNSQGLSCGRKRKEHSLSQMKCRSKGKSHKCRVQAAIPHWWWQTLCVLGGTEANLVSLLRNGASLHLLAALGTPGWCNVAAFRGVNHCIGLGQMPEQEGISFSEAVRWQTWTVGLRDFKQYLAPPPLLSSVPSDDHLTFLSLFSHCKADLSNTTLWEHCAK